MYIGGWGRGVQKCFVFHGYCIWIYDKNSRKIVYAYNFINDFLISKAEKKTKPETPKCYPTSLLSAAGESTET